MRIAVVANSRWNIINFRMELVHALVADGHELFLFAPNDHESTEKIASISWVVTHALNRGGKNPFADAAYFRELSRLYRVLSIEVTLQYTIKPVIYGSLAAARNKVRAVNTVTGLGYTFLNFGIAGSIARKLYRTSLHRASHTFFQNKDDRDLFVSRGYCPAALSSVVPGSGVDVVSFAQAPLKTKGVFKFLFVGRLLLDKGIREYVEAARLLRQEAKEIEFHVVGEIDPANPASLTAGEVANWKSLPNVIYHGQQKDVAAFIRKASVVVLPSYREGLPRVMLEAAAIGRPLLATDVAGCREIVRPNVNGWLFAARNATALAEVMKEVVHEEPAVLERYARQSRQIAEKEYAVEVVIEYYRQLLEAMRKFPAVSNGYTTY